MEQALTAISPIDGRYAQKTKELSAYFSEFALIRYRLRVEVEYFIALCQLPLPQLAAFDARFFADLRAVYTGFSLEDAKRVKEIERLINHDVKAVEYFLKQQVSALGLERFSEFVHFGLTSQDINNTAVPLLLQEACQDVIYPTLASVQAQIVLCAGRWENVPMLAHTHGQPASPTNMGKEMAVFAYRLKEQIKVLQKTPFNAKFGGATGNFNAHHLAFPETDWIAFAKDFVENRLGLNRSLFTTQIENYDQLAALLDAFKRISTILIDFSQDIWQYVSMGYFGQKINAQEVGSSAMPHKVNPIDFENAEGNLGIARAIMTHLSAKLPLSRLQRDLTDSTVLRNLGVPLAHLLIALKSLEKGIKKLTLNTEAINRDLENNWAVVSEALQTILRREGYPKPYETLKKLTRTNQKVEPAQIRDFINQLDLPEETKEILRKITPYNYTGIFPPLKKL